MTTATEIGAISVRIAADTSGLTAGIAAARRNLSDATGAMSQSLSAVEDGAHTVFGNLTRSLERTAAGGRMTMKDMVDSILSDLRRLAVNTFVSRPLEGVFDSLLSSALGFGGARAAGGPVAPGRAFLVGERGPELFVPGEAGNIVPAHRLTGAPTVVFNVQASDAQSFVRSQGQIAAMLTRATMRGQRNL